MPRLWLDTETYSETPISAGTHQYVDAGKGAEIMLFAYAFDEEPVRVVDLTQGEELPARVLEAFSDPSIILTAHNAAFDRTRRRTRTASVSCSYSASRSRQAGSSRGRPPRLIRRTGSIS